jgi:hypothetical protein
MAEDDKRREAAVQEGRVLTSLGILSAWGDQDLVNTYSFMYSIMYSSTYKMFIIAGPTDAVYGHGVSYDAPNSKAKVKSKKPEVMYKHSPFPLSAATSSPPILLCRSTQLDVPIIRSPSSWPFHS